MGNQLLFLFIKVQISKYTKNNVHLLREVGGPNLKKITFWPSEPSIWSSQIWSIMAKFFFFKIWCIIRKGHEKCSEINVGIVCLAQK